MELSFRIATFVTSSTGVTVLCLSIVIWGVVAYLFYRTRMAPLYRQLRSACRLIDDIPGEEALAARLESVDERLRELPVMKHPWSEFRETLMFPEIEDEAQVLYNSSSAEEFFARDELLGEHINLRLYNALPNLLTGAGILGTFIGLVAGIYLAQGGLANPEHALDAVQQLLGGASLAFLTSIAGLLSSIVFSTAEKDWLHRFEQARQHWVAGLDGRLRRVTLEALGRKSLVQHRAQTEVLTQFSEQLAFQIAEIFEKRMPEVLSESLGAPLTEALNDVRTELARLAENQTRANEDTLREIVDKFTSSIESAAGEEMREFARTVQTMVGQVKEQVQAVAAQQEAVRAQSEESVQKLAETFSAGAQELQGRVTDSVVEILGGLDGTVERMSEQLDSTVDRISTELDRTAKVFRDSVAGLSGSIDEIRGILTRSKELMEYLDDLIAATRQSHSALERTAVSVAQSASGMETATEHAAAFSEGVNQAAQEVRGMVNRLAEAQSTVEQVWSGYEQRFAQVDESLAKLVQEIQEGLDNYAENVSNFVQQLDQHTAKITGMLAGAVAELKESIDEQAALLEESKE